MSVEAQIASGSVLALAVPEWADLPWLVHGFSTRVGGTSTAYLPANAAGGELNLGFTAQDSRQTVEANRALLLAHLLGPASLPRPARLVTLRQTHSAIIHRVDSSHLLPLGAPAVLQGDGLMTDQPDVPLGILTADCVPVLVVDRRRRAAAAFHAGWRGTVQEIVEQGIARMVQEFGSVPEDLLAAVGPAIGACCYTVGDEVRVQFEARFAYAADLFSVASDGSALHLNLAEANRRQLLAAGVRDKAITVLGACTSCRTDLFFTHRASHGVTGRMMAVIGVRCC